MIKRFQTYNCKACRRDNYVRIVELLPTKKIVDTCLYCHYYDDDIKLKTPSKKKLNQFQNPSQLKLFPNKTFDDLRDELFEKPYSINVGKIIAPIIYSTNSN